MKPDIKDYPIFEVGTWNKMEFTEADLDEIAANYSELEKQHQVPLKLGHNDKQPLTDGQPALGWIANVRRVGKQLLADFSDMPKIIKDMIAKKRFRAVSVELLMGLKRGDKSYKYVLDAVAILGAEQPAVHTLPDLNLFLAKRSLAYDEGGRRVAFERQVDRVSFTSRKEPGGSMDEEEVKRMIAAATGPLQAEMNTLREQNADYKKKFTEEEDKRIKAESIAKDMKAKDDARDAEANTAKVKMARDNVTALLEEGVKAKKITPAQRDKAIKMFGINDDVLVLKVDVAEVREFFSLTKEDTRVLNGDRDTTTSRGDDQDPDRVHKDVFQETHRRVRLEMGKSPKLTYKDASRIVFNADPELHKEYVNTNPPERFVAAGGAQ